MPFRLSRGGANVAAEVQRWQYFLLKHAVTQVGSVDGDFGPKSETATRIFQMAEGLAQSGKVDAATLNAAQAKGYTILPDTYYSDRGSVNWPPAPAGLSSPTNPWRNATFECFNFLKKPNSGDSIVIKGNCAGTKPDWIASNIIDLEAPEFSHLPGFPGYIRCHRLAGPKIGALLQAWKAADLLHLVISYGGAFEPRYIRGKAPAGGHGLMQSTNVDTLSNHAFGTAFDINATQNWIGTTPAICGRKGALRELVAAANANGLFWGGHFQHRLDGMHFEAAA